MHIFKPLYEWLFIRTISNMKRILLWIAVLPGAVIAAIVLTIVVKYSFQFWHDDPDDWHWLRMLHYFISRAVESFAFPLIFVILGMAIAPNFKRETGIFLIAMMIVYVLTLLVLFVSFGVVESYLNTNSVIFYVFHFFGCIAAFFYIPKSDEHFKESWVN
jgi:hypothetical protein